ETGNLRIGIKGNPSFGDIRTLMLGLKNGNGTNGRDICGEAWFNELRLSDLQNKGGWAGILNLDANLADFATVSATGRQTTVGFGGIDEGPNQRSREDVKSYDLVTNINAGQLLPKKWGLQIPFNYAVGEEVITPQYDPLYTDIELQTSLDNAASSAERKNIEGRSIDHTLRRSVNLIGVRKERIGKDTKPMPYDIENLSLSYSYNQEDHKDFEIEQSRNQSVRAGATYNYTFNSKPYEPFKANDSLFTSKYWKLLKDFNINYLPSNISLTTNIARQYSQQRFRDITASEGFLAIPEFSQRNYLFDRQFSINYPLTESFRINFDQSQNRIIRNYLQDDDSLEPDAGGIYEGFFDVGTPNRHYQTLQANYDLPINKIPYLEFIDATYSYTADFQWNRGSSQLQSLEGIPNLGNSVENANTHALNGSFDMSAFYKSIGLVKKQPAGAVGSSRSARSRAVPTLGDKEDKSNQNAQGGGTLTASEKVKNTAIGLLTAVKRIQVNYQQNNGTYIPGYLPGVGFIGTLKPTTGFIFGSQSEVRDYAARQGWLTLYQEFNQQYREVENRQLDIQSQVEFIPDLTIDLNMNRIYQETYNENYRVDPQSLKYESLSGSTYGNFTISTLMIGSAFGKNTAEISTVFDNFKANRLVVAERLAQNFYGTTEYPRDDNGYPVGYGRTNQAVLIPAFLSAYTGGNAGNVSLGAFRSFPLPNWNLKYTGFMKLDWFKKRFKRFSVNHGYRAGYTINQFNTNLNYNRQRNTSPVNAQVDQAGNFLNETLYSNINLVEQFSPLIRLDFEMQNSVKILAEIRKDRALSLSFDNNLMTEINGNEYIIGLGYRLKDLTFATSVGGKKTILKSDLNFKADLSLRQNETVVRYLDIDNNQVTSGQDIYGLRFTADYALSKNLTAIFYYDHSFATYAISTAFPQTTIRSGFTLRYNFGN
ncbi:MAG: cell surface protein SprA, partial [Leeuwenhoekiella sp.]